MEKGGETRRGSNGKRHQKRVLLGDFMTELSSRGSERKGQSSGKNQPAGGFTKRNQNGPAGRGKRSKLGGGDFEETWYTFEFRRKGEG